MVEIDSERSTVLIGIVVDSVSEVLNIQEKDIEQTPAFGSKLDIAYIMGMAKIDGRVKILLNIDKVLSTEEITAIEKTV